MSRLADLPQRAPAKRPIGAVGAFAFLNEREQAPEPITLRAVDAETLHGAVASWTEQGHAITFGRTSDGGAVSVTLLAGGQRKSRYFPDVAELESFLQLIAQSAGNLR